MKKRKSNDGQPGYYPGYHTLSQQAYWDEATRKTVLERVTRSRELHFFTPEEAPLIEAIFEHLLPQSDRDEKYRIPIVPVVDERLYKNRLDGYRYEGYAGGSGCLPDRDAGHRGDCTDNTWQEIP